MSIPIIIIVANITMLILTIINYKKYIRYAICQLTIVLISMLPIILVSEHIVENKTLSFVASGISILNLIITLVLSKNDVKEAIVRKFHW